MVKVSIIVPVYNTAQYLRQCVDSLIAQTLSDIEIILVDDGSTDDSPRICDDYARSDARIKVIHKANGGASSARNCGMRIAKGKYLAFVDSDDVCDHRMYEQLVRVAEENQVKMVICSAYYLCGDCAKPFSCNDARPAIEMIESHTMISRLWNSEYDCNIFTTPCNKLYLREFFAGKILLYREGIICEDDEVANRLYLQKYDIAVVNRPYYYWRMNPDSISHKPFGQRNCVFLSILSDRVSAFESIGMRLAAQKTAKVFCEIYIEYYIKAWQNGHKEWVEGYREVFIQMRKYIANDITLKTKTRYMLFDIFPYFYLKCILMKRTKH